MLFCEQTMISEGSAATAASHARRPAAPSPSPWLQRTEHLLLLAPLLLLTYLSYHSLLDSPHPQCAPLAKLEARLAGISRDADSSPMWRDWNRFLWAVNWAKCKEGVATLIGMGAMIGMAAIAMRFEPKNRTARRGATSGLTIGLMMLPMMIAAQLLWASTTHLPAVRWMEGFAPLHALSRLWWLALCCSVVALGNVVAGSGQVVSVEDGDPTEIIVTLSLSFVGMAFQDSQFCATRGAPLESIRGCAAQPLTITSVSLLSVHALQML